MFIPPLKYLSKRSMAISKKREKKNICVSYVKKKEKRKER
jgi:hypothetical protein